jgi:hypothetical protein
VKHAIEPLTSGGMLSGFKAQLHMRQLPKPAAKPWWQWRAISPHLV